ncbi:MAG: VanZ family protein [Gammaproteobacteria bacterium]
MDRRLLYRLPVLLALMAGTVAFFSNFERYENASPELLVNGDFSAGRDHWKRTGRANVRADYGVLTIAAPTVEQDGAMRQTLAASGQRLFRLQAELRGDSINPGPAPWESARLVLISLNENKRRVGIEEAARIEGTREWQRVARVIEVPARAQTVQVVLQILESSGTVQARYISLHAVSERHDYLKYRYLGIALWVLVLAWVLAPIAKNLRFGPPQMAIYAMLLAIAAGALMPAAFKESLQAGIGQHLPAAIQERMAVGEKASGGTVFDYTPVAKAGHFLAFALLAFLLCRVLAIRGIHYALLLIVLLAGVSEVLQFFVSGRTPGVSDIFVDLGGAAFGAGLALLWGGLRRGQ